MGYSPPSLDTLHKFLRTLESTTHSERKKTIESLKAHEKNPHRDAILGAIILEAEKIDLEYKNPLIPTTLYSAKRSDLYNELQSTKCLNNSVTNPLNPEEKLVYLWHYYQQRKEQLSESKEVKGSLSLDAEFQPVVDHVLGQIPNLKVILSERPTLDTIMKSLQSIPQIYHRHIFKSREGLFSKVTKGAPSIDHIKFAKLLEFIASDHMDELLGSLKGYKTKENRDVFKYMVCYGAILYMMKFIEKNEYTGVTSIGTNPQDSCLYALLSQTLNLSHTDDLDGKIKLIFFAEFRDFLKILQENETALKALKKSPYSYPSRLGTYYATFSDADTFLKSTSKQLETIYDSESYLWSGIKWVANYAVQTILVTACLEIAAGIYTAGIGVGVLPFIFGKLGNRFMGGVLGERVARVFAAQIEPAVMTNVYANTMWFAGKQAVGTLIPSEDPLFSACETSKKFRSELHDEVTQPSKSSNPLLTAILDLPSKQISQKIKERITQMIIQPVKTIEESEAKVEAERPGMKL